MNRLDIGDGEYTPSELTNDRKGRMERAKNMKGRNVVLATKNEEGLLEIVATENEGIRTEAQAKEVMSSNDIVGTVYALRPLAWGKKNDGSITRNVQTVAQFS